MPTVDLGAYCTRIGYPGPRTPTLDTLRQLHRLHQAAIAFENIDVLLGRGVDITPAAVDAKLITAGRGGYCYEHNSLFKRVLSTLGFEVEGLAARVLHGTPADASRPRTHMALRVIVDGEPWLADVGFGGGGPTQPLHLDNTAPQQDLYDTFRCRPCADGLLLEAMADGQWTPVYVLAREPQLDADYLPPNWYTSTHPDSHFRHRLMVARTTTQARYTLSDSRLSIRKPGSRPERRMLDAGQIEKALAERFLLPVEASWYPIIEQATRRA